MVESGDEQEMNGKVFFLKWAVGIPYSLELTMEDLQVPE